MASSHPPNTYRIVGDVAYIDLLNRAGDVVAIALVDAADMPDLERLARRWHKAVNGGVIANSGTAKTPGSISLGRLLLDLKASERVRHINGNKLDNRRANLRQERPADMVDYSKPYQSLVLPCGRVALVSNCDVERVMRRKWHSKAHHTGTSYVISHIGGNQNIKLHRFVLNAPEGVMVDHVNRDPLDNRRENLRLADPSINSINSVSRKATASGYRGVLQSARCNDRWRARIQINGRSINLGAFGSAEDAARAYNDAASRYHGEFAQLNAVPC